MQPAPQGERQARLHWRDLQLEDIDEYPTEEPLDPKVGDRWYCAETHSLCIWDGIEWDPVPLD